MPIFKVQEHLLQSSYIREYPRSLADENDDDLRLVVKQYSPLDNPAPHDGDLTFIGAHANGFPKELYEPLWEELYQRLKALGHKIRNIFIADVAWQGQSSVLNASKLGNDPNWMDASRDLFLMVNHFRNDIKHPIVGIGHSMGGNMLVNLSHMHPRLFTSLILIDPVIMRVPYGIGGYMLAAASSLRRDHWPNRAEAEASFKKSKFYQSWDPRVLDLWFKYGLRELPQVVEHTNDAAVETNIKDQKKEPEVVLTTPKHQEVFTFLRSGYKTDEYAEPFPQAGLSERQKYPDLDPRNGAEGPFYRPELHVAFYRLATLRPSTMFIFAGKSDLSAEPLNDDKLKTTGTGPGGSGGAKEGRVKGVMMEKASHLVPFEDVSGVAQHCIAWIVPELTRFVEETTAQRSAWEKVPKDEKAVLSKSQLKSLKQFLPQRPSEKPADKGSKL